MSRESRIRGHFRKAIKEAAGVNVGRLVDLFSEELWAHQAEERGDRWVWCPECSRRMEMAQDAAGYPSCPAHPDVVPVNRPPQKVADA